MVDDATRGGEPPLSSLALGVVLGLGSWVALSSCGALLRWPGWHDVQTSAALPLGLPCAVIVGTAWLHHRRAPTGRVPTWILLGALVLLPMSVLVAEGTGDPSLVGWTGTDRGGRAEFAHVLHGLMWVGLFAVVVFVLHRTWPRAVSICLRALAWALAALCTALSFAAITRAPTQRLEVLDAWIDALPTVPAYRDADSVSSDGFVSVPPPPFFERASVLAFTPNDDWRGHQTFVMPDAEGTLSLHGSMLRIEGARGGCFVPRGADRAVLATSARGWAVFMPQGGERVCSLTHDSFREPWVPASNAGLVGLTVPREVPAMLGAAALLAVALLGVATRARRGAGVLAHFVEATLIPGGEAPSTVRLPDGSLARLEGDSPTTSAVLVAPSRGDTGYREDVRRTVGVWVAAGVSRDEVLARLHREAETAEASAVVTATWLSLPAFVAWSHGHVISPW